MATRFAPGDLITSDLINQILDRLDALAGNANTARFVLGPLAEGTRTLLALGTGFESGGGIFLDGAPLLAGPPARGINLVILDPTLNVKFRGLYDTFANPADSNRLVGDLQAQTSRYDVVCGVTHDAYRDQLQTNAKSALAAIGADALGDATRTRDNAAFIGVVPADKSNVSFNYLVSLMPADAQGIGSAQLAGLPFVWGLYSTPLQRFLLGGGAGTLGVPAPQGKGTTKETSKETAKETAKEIAKEAVKETAKETTKEIAKETAKEIAKEVAKESKEFVKETAKEINEGGTVKITNEGGAVKITNEGGTIKATGEGGTVKVANEGGTVKAIEGGVVKSAGEGGLVKTTEVKAVEGGGIAKAVEGGTVKAVESGGTVKAIEGGGIVKAIEGGGVVKAVEGGGVIGNIHHVGIGQPIAPQAEQADAMQPFIKPEERPNVDEHTIKNAEQPPAKPEDSRVERGAHKPKRVRRTKSKT